MHRFQSSQEVLKDRGRFSVLTGPRGRFSCSRISRHCKAINTSEKQHDCAAFLLPSFLPGGASGIPCPLKCLLATLTRPGTAVTLSVFGRIRAFSRFCADFRKETIIFSPEKAKLWLRKEKCFLRKVPDFPRKQKRRET